MGPAEVCDGSGLGTRPPFFLRGPGLRTPYTHRAIALYGIGGKGTRTLWFVMRVVDPICLLPFTRGRSPEDRPLPYWRTRGCLYGDAVRKLRTVRALALEAVSVALGTRPGKPGVKFVVGAIFAGHQRPVFHDL